MRPHFIGPVPGGHKQQNFCDLSILSLMISSHTQDEFDFLHLGGLMSLKRSMDDDNLEAAAAWPTGLHAWVERWCNGVSGV